METIDQVIQFVSSEMARWGWPTASLRLRDSRPLPGGWCVGVEVHAVDGSHHGTVWVAQINGEAPPGITAVDHLGVQWGIWAYPQDPELPGLPAAVTPGALRDLLPKIDHTMVATVSLTPLAQAVVRIGLPGKSVYVKVLPPDVVDAVGLQIMEIHQRLRDAGIPAPEVIAVDCDRGFIATCELTGTPLTVHLENGAPLPDGAQLWALISRLATVPIGRPSPAPTLASSFRAAADRLVETGPHLADQFQQLREKVSEGNTAATWAATIHGDLHGRQLLVDETGCVVGVVDLEDVGVGDLYDDLGRLLAHIAARCVTHPARRVAAEALIRDLLAALSVTMDPAVVRRRAAMGMVVLADAARRMPPENRPAEPDEFLAAAENLLNEG